MSDCIFEIHQLWQPGFSRVYSNCCRSCWFEPEIVKFIQSSHKMYSNIILNFQESTTIWNACTNKVWKLIEGTTYISVCVNIYIYICKYVCVFIYVLVCVCVCVCVYMYKYIGVYVFLFYFGILRLSVYRHSHYPSLNHYCIRKIVI